MVAYDTPYTQFVAQIEAQALPIGDFAEAAYSCTPSNASTADATNFGAAAS